MMWKKCIRIFVAGILWCSQSLFNSKAPQADVASSLQNFERQVPVINSFLAQMQTTQNLFKFLARAPGPEQQIYRYMAENLPNENLPQLEMQNG